MRCPTCTYSKLGLLIHVCGFCEEKGIKDRITWWQEGKKKLKEREENRKN